MTRWMTVALGSGLSAWAGWSMGKDFGILPGFLIGNVGFAIGWYLSRKFVRDNLDC